MWSARGKASFVRALDVKGEDIQKISVIHSLPSLLEGDSQGCLTRMIPKMQQTLPMASTEFHLVASSTFKNVLEKNLVSYSIFSRTFLQSILNSLESRDPVISHAWLETLLDVIELLPVDIIREEILPRAINKGQLMQTVASRVICCKLVGKICTRFDSVQIKKEILPTVHSLCQDVNSEVRACICLQLHHVAESLDPESVISALLPSLVELASDEESNVRYASVQTIVDLLPHLQEDTKKSTIIPLVKKLFESALKSDDNVILIISKIFGKFALVIKKSLNKKEYFWFVQYFQQLAQLGICSVKKEAVQVDFIPFGSESSAYCENYVQVRQNCANSMPSMLMFVVSMAGDVNVLLATFSNLANDPYFIVRKSVACSIHEIAIVLDSRIGLIKTEFINLLRCDANEVIHGLVPHLGQMLLLLARSKTIGTELTDSAVTEIGKALIKCESEISRTNNWRLSETIMDQLQVLPKCFSSDYIYTNFVPLTVDRVLNARPIPVRVAAGRTLLVFLRNNLKSVQRTELRNKIHAELAHSQNCYTRMLFTRIMNEALSLFSSVYFKEHFFFTLLSMTEDPIPNVRLKVVTMLPTLKTLLQFPTDKKLLVVLEKNIRHLMSTEKDKDVVSALMQATRTLNDIEVEHEGQAISSSISKLKNGDLIKYEEEQKLENMAAGSSVKTNIQAPKTGAIRRTSFGEASTYRSNKIETEILSKLMSSPSGKDKQPADKTSSMPELPVTFLDDEFITDAGIRIPSQFSMSQSTSKISNLYDISYRNKGPNADRSRRYSGCDIAYFQKVKPKRQEYEEPTKPISSIYLPPNAHCRDEAKQSWHSDKQQLARSSKCNKYSVSKTKSDRGMCQEKSFDGMESNSDIISRTVSKQPPPRNLPDRSKRHSGTYSLKLPDTRDIKPNFKRHSIEVTDQTPVERTALRRNSTFDVNHNQGPSKIPLRSFQSKCRTAPVTRATSPIRTEAMLCFQKNASQETNAESSFQERRLGRFIVSYEEVDKLCQKLLYSPTAPRSQASGPKSKDSRLPIRLRREKL